MKEIIISNSTNIVKNNRIRSEVINIMKAHEKAQIEITIAQLERIEFDAKEAIKRLKKLKEESE